MNGRHVVLRLVTGHCQHDEDSESWSKYVTTHVAKCLLMLVINKRLLFTSE